MLSPDGNTSVPPALISALIAGLGERPIWSGFVAQLRDALAADYASIIFRPAAEGARYPGLVHIFAGEGSPPQVSQRYRERLHRLDPLPYHALAPGRVYALPELLVDDDPLHEAYRAQLLAPSGMNHLRILRFEDADGGSGWLSASRRAGDFGGAAAALMAALAPLLAAGLTAHLAGEREQTRALVAGEGMRRMNFGWLTLDAGGRILDADASAEAMLAVGDALARDAAGRLAARDAGASAALAAALAADNRRARAVVLRRQPWTDMLIVPLAPAPGGVRPAPALAVYLHSDRVTGADQHARLGTLFGLTPREAALAVALGRGLSIAEAAAEMTLTVGSARTYSKRIYAKTGARGQGDLIRLVHRSVATLG